MDLTVASIAQIVGNAPPLGSDATATGYSIDSRTLRPGDLFFAFRGERSDGHDHVLPALAAGAAGAVVEASRLPGYPAAAQARLLGVPNVLEALQKLAAAVRRSWGGPVVAVTGSTGKTTTKQMIASLLGVRFRVLESERNLNNALGLPLSLLRLQRDTEVGVFELGMSAPGEIRSLAALAAPNLGVVTNVSAAHLQFFPDVEAIAAAKHELIEMLEPGAWAVLNAEDSRVSAFAAEMDGRVLTFGVSHPAHFQARSLEANSHGGTLFSLEANSYETIPAGVMRGGELPAGRSPMPGSPGPRFHLPLPGRHNVLNVLAALAVCYAFGITPESLKKAVAALRPVSMRGEIARMKNGALILNDCYNSSPAALEAMLVTAAALPARRRIAVLGGMMELGDTSESLHRRAGSRVAELGFDGLFTVGEQARFFAEGARAAGLRPDALSHFETPGEAGENLRKTLQEGDVVLLKGSRAVHLEKVWERLEPLLESGS